LTAMIAQLFQRLRERFGWPEALIVIALASEIAVALGAHHFPYLDPPNHLARYSLIARIWFGDPPGYVVMHWVPTSYMGGDIVGALLVHFIGASATLRLVDVAALTLLPLGMYALLLQTAPMRRGWALIGVLFGFAAHFLFGFLNYSLGVGLVFCWLALWYPRREEATWTARIVLAVGVIVLFLVHLTAPLIVLVVIWTDYLIAVIGENVILPPFRWRIPNARLPTILMVTTAVALVWLLASYSSWKDVGPAGQYVFPLFKRKLVEFVYPFRSVSLFAAVVMLVGYMASLIAMLYLRRKSFRVDAFTASAVAMFVLYLLFPHAIPGAGGVDIRWLTPGYLLLFCGQQRDGEREPRVALLIVFAACLLHTAVMGWTARKIDRDLDTFDTALAHVPPGTNLLPLGEEARMYYKVPVMEHFVLWHTIRAHGRAPGLFNYHDASYEDPLNHHLAHFVEPTHLFLPDLKWGEPHDMPGLPWPRIDEEYDYILQLAGGSRARSYLRQHADEVWHDETLVLYKVRKP
jgi:hypothetical protein